MPLVTDPRQIIRQLPASLIKELPDATVSISRASAAKRSEATERKLQLGRGPAPERILETEAGKQPATSTEAIAPPPGREIRDQLWRHKVLVECWSLNASKEFHGELDPMTPETKELCQQEAILWAARERDRDKWMAFE